MLQLLVAVMGIWLTVSYVVLDERAQTAAQATSPFSPRRSSLRAPGLSAGADLVSADCWSRCACRAVPGARRCATRWAYSRAAAR